MKTTCGKPYLLPAGIFRSYHAVGVSMETDALPGLVMPNVCCRTSKVLVGQMERWGQAGGGPNLSTELPTKLQCELGAPIWKMILGRDKRPKLGHNLIEIMYKMPVEICKTQKWLQCQVRLGISGNRPLRDCLHLGRVHTYTIIPFSDTTDWPNVRTISVQDSSLIQQWDSLKGWFGILRMWPSKA